LRKQLATKLPMVLKLHAVQARIHCAVPNHAGAAPFERLFSCLVPTDDVPVEERPPPLDVVLHQQVRQ
jgi:hypothetical protein